MRKLALASVVMLLGASLVGCGESSEPGSITKEQARASGGKNDHGLDLCGYFGWYGDGVCDDFCPSPDPDCDGGEQRCGGLAGLTCGAGQYCHYEEGDFCGAADALGTCREIPTICTREFAPVCGCDGQTYSNACNAHAAGTSVASQGPCEGTDGGAGGERRCGGFAGFTCGEGQFCDYEPEAQCGAADQLGTCRDIPTICTREFAPVCGCDGNTYSNRCNANAAGTAVAHEGECGGGSDGGTGGGGERRCGGIAGLTCGEGQFCDYEPEAQCGAADQLGTCRDIPTICTREFAPVCGCDGRTYSNRCNAAARGVAVFRDGEC